MVKDLIYILDKQHSLEKQQLIKPLDFKFIISIPQYSNLHKINLEYMVNKITFRMYINW